MKKRWILIALTVLFLWVMMLHFTELQQLKNILSQGVWELVLAAIVLQAAYYMVFSWTYQSAFDMVDLSARTRDLLPVTLGSLFVNVVAPVGRVGGAALFAEDLARRGKSVARSAAGVLLQLTADFVSFMLILIPGVIYLFIENNLKTYEIMGAVIIFLLTFGLSIILLMGVWKRDWLHRLFDWSHRTANWIFGRLNQSLLLADDWAQKNAEEFDQAFAAATNHPSRLVRTVGIAFLAHLVNLSSLYVLFLAFNQPVGLGTLVAGYAVGVLFWIVSTTPQGIGVVEGGMALTFTVLGISGAAAITVALTFRVLTFWLPMVLGFFAVQCLQTVGANQRTLTETWGVRFAAVLVALMGIVNILSAVTPSLSYRLAILEDFFPLEVRHGGHLTAALAGFALLILAGNLSRRKLVAWVLTLAVLGISMVSHLVKGLDYEEASLAGGLMILLWQMRDHFHARSDRPSIQQGLRVLAQASLFTLAYGVIGFFLLDRHYKVSFGLWDALRQTVVMFTQFYDPGLVPLTRFGNFFANSIYIVGAVTIGYAGLMLLRPVFVRKPTTDEERRRAQAIIEKYARSSLARFLLFEDKRYFFSEGGSVIGYALAGRTAVVLGDPVGPDDNLLPSIEAFAALCQRNDWMPVFYQTQPGTLATYKSAGFDALSIGNEGVVNLDTFTLEGKESKPLRAPINKLKNAGYKFIVHEPPISDDLLEELRAISDEWLTMMHGTEKRFSLGWFDDEYIRNSLIGAVYTPEGWISAFINFVPEYQLSEATVDLMRRRAEIENGTMEFLFVSLFQWAKAQGYHGFNLGLSSLSGVGEQPTDPAIERIMHFIYENVNQFYNFKGLHSFKEKFHPEWSPRYLIYRGTANLAQAWLAVIQVSSEDDNFLMDYFRKKK
jgi:phosphatidylglycerol lysyltransferase